MRIRGFAPYITNYLEDYTLEKCHVVIDGQNFFYSTYKDSQCVLLTGGEYDRYATYLRELMECFQKCEIQCHVIFKGGHSGDLDKRIKNYYRDVNNAVTINSADLRSPILTRNVAQQILDELGIRYAVTEYESKKDIIDLAMTLNCPVISFDIEFCFYKVDYIPSVDINFENGKMKCKVYRLNRFIESHQISEDALKLFGATLNQEQLTASFYNSVLPKIRNNSPWHVIRNVLYLLKSDTETFRQKVLRIFDTEQKNKFLKTEKLIQDCFSYTGNQTFITEYVLNGNLIFEQNDALWFAKGVCLGRIGISYIDLIKHRMLFGSWDVEDLTAEDSLMLSLEIVRYAYDLLTSFDGSTFTFMCREGTDIKKVEVTSALSIPRPDMLVDGFFKNGWTDFTPLFNAFMENIPLNSESLEQIPESARMLMITLVYFSHRSQINASFTYSVLLCYVLLNHCFFRKADAVQETDVEASADTTSEKAMQVKTEWHVAAAVTSKYFVASDSQLQKNLDRKILHPLVQFQNCLYHMNHLNTLCATKYPSTIYYKTLNGSFIYNMMKQLEKETQPLLFLKKLLSETPTPLSIFLQLVQFHEEST